MFIAGAGGGGAVGAVNANSAGTFANRPSSAPDGTIYFLDDTLADYLRRESGAWVKYKKVGSGEFKVVTPPTTGWSWVNQGTSTISSVSEVGELLTAQASTALDFRIRARTLPSDPYTIVCAFRIINWGEGTNDDDFAVMLRDSAGGGFVNMFGTGRPYFNPSAFTNDFNSTSAFSANNTKDTDGFPVAEPPGEFWIRISDNSTNRKTEFWTGTQWRTLLDEGRTAHVTPDQFGFGCTSRNSPIQPAMLLFSYEES